MIQYGKGRQLDQMPPRVSDNGQIVVYKDRRAVQLVQLLQKHNGSRQKVAQELGVSTTTLWRYLKKFGINKDGSF